MSISWHLIWRFKRYCPRIGPCKIINII